MGIESTGRRGVAFAVAVAAALACGGVARAGVAYLGKATIAGGGTDASGLNNTLEDGSRNNSLDGFGSGIAYTGYANRYVLIPDRGPNASTYNPAVDNTTSWNTRFQIIDINVTPSPTPGASAVVPTFAGTSLLTNGSGQSLTGLSTAFDSTNSAAGSRRFDPEGIRVGPNGHVYISDEYGPFVKEFTQSGQLVRNVTVPSKFLIGSPAATGNAELPPANAAGRQANRGMEGLAISPDGSKLYGIMQSPLIQDGGLNSSNGRVGTNNRILEINTATGATREFLYPMENARNGVSEILAVNGNELLVDERDGNGGTAAAFKRLYKINLAGATDVSSVSSLPSTGVPGGVTAVSKSLLLDLLDPSLGLAGSTFPEKIEGMAFGPDLADGRHLLLVTVDNDFGANPNTIFAFAVDGDPTTGLSAFQSQAFPGGFTFIPEPSSLSLVGFGGLLLARRRGKNSLAVS